MIGRPARRLWSFLLCGLLAVTVGAEALAATPGAVPLLFDAAASSHDSAPSTPTTAGPHVTRSRHVTGRIDVLTNPDRSPRLAAGDRVGLNLFDDADFTLTITDVTEQPGGGRAWSGTLDGVDDGYGIVVLHRGALVGTVITPGGVYRIGYAPNGAQVVEELDASKLPGEAKPVAPPPSPLPDSAIPQAATDSGSQIDVMVVYTAAARTAAGGAAAIQAEAVAAVAAANQAYANNGLVQRLQLVFTGEVAIKETGDFDADLNALQANAAVAALRDSNGADLVTLLASNGPNAAFCGIGFLMLTNSTAFAPNGFNVVERICASANLTYPHELGHNMGAAHDPYVGGQGLFAYSHGYVNPSARIRTIMAYDDQCQAAGYTCTRIPYFSTPNQTYTGQTIGTAATADNVRTLSQTADTVANFRPSVGYALSNSGDIVVAQGVSGLVTITASLQGSAVPPISFSVSGLPGGASASFSVASCTPPCSTDLTIALSPATAIGTFAITVTAAPQGRTTTFNLVVKEGFNYTLINARGISVPQGGSGTTTISALLQSSLIQAVSFAVSGLPVGAAAGFSLGACVPTCSTVMTITTSSVTPVGTFPIVVTGTPNGMTTTVTLDVTPFSDGVAVFVVGLYQNVLGRSLDAAELTYWADYLHQQCGVATIRATVDTLFDSAEFRQRPLTLPALVTTIYRSLLVRDPEPEARAGWSAVFRADRRSMAITFVGSPEFQSLLPDRTNRSAVTVVVNRFYTEILGRAPTDREASSWVAYIVGTRDVEGTVAAFVTSLEFELRPLTFRDYVATLYRSVLARSPGQAELDAWELTLRGRLIQVIDTGFIPSPEFQGRIPRICEN